MSLGPGFPEPSCFIDYQELTASGDRDAWIRGIKTCDYISPPGDGLDQSNWIDANHNVVVIRFVVVWSQLESSSGRGFGLLRNLILNMYRSRSSQLGWKRIKPDFERRARCHVHCDGCTSAQHS
jgi:hypothetical protein